MAVLDVKRKNALAYIASDPTDIAFKPRERTSDGSGGYTWSDPALLTAQSFRLITSGNIAVVRTSVDGKSVTPDILIMGPWDAQVKEGWEFLVDGRKHEVVYVLPDVKHCVLAEVIRRG